MKVIDRRKGHPGKNVLDGKTDVPFSQWAHPRNKDLSVTRGELVVILFNFKRQLDEDRWYNRLWEWLKHGWLPRRGLRVDGGVPGADQPAKPEVVV